MTRDNGGDTCTVCGHTCIAHFTHTHTHRGKPSTPLSLVPLVLSFAPAPPLSLTSPITIYCTATSARKRVTVVERRRLRLSGEAKKMEKHTRAMRKTGKMDCKERGERGRRGG